MATSKHIMGTYSPEDKVVKLSGKPFKSGRKIATIKSLQINPHSKKQAAEMKEDGTVVDLQQIRKATVVEVNSFGDK